MDSSISKEIFANETGYASQKVDIRAAVFKNNRILLVKRKADGKWSLPGSWGDGGLSPSEVTVKEVKKESGFDVYATKWNAVFDKKFHGHPPSHHMYIIEIISGHPTEGVETSKVRTDISSIILPRKTEVKIQAFI